MSILAFLVLYQLYLSSLDGPSCVAKPALQILQVTTLGFLSILTATLWKLYHGACDASAISSTGRIALRSL